MNAGGHAQGLCLSEIADDRLGCGTLRTGELASLKRDGCLGIAGLA
jgi:hypothetical protein